MTWQEELRKLDEDLANGTLSADDYRVRRDQILSAAVTAGPPEAQQSSSNGADSTQIIEPVSPPGGMPRPSTGSQQPPQSPQQPQQPAQQHAPNSVSQPHPQTGSQPGQMPPAPEATQAVSYDSSAERTQAVPQWQGATPNYQQPGMQSPPQGFAPPGWNAWQEDSAPPWGGGDLPPIAPQQAAGDGGFDWGGGVSQGPEGDEKKSSGNGRKILSSVLGVVLVAGIGFAVWALFINNNGDTSTPPGTLPSASSAPTSKALPAPPPAKPEPSSDAESIIQAPGTPRAGGGPFTVDSLTSNKILPDPVISALQQGGMTSGLLNASTQGPSTVGIFSLTLPNPTSATTVANAYADAQKNGGLSLNKDLSMQGVPVYNTGSKATQGVYRAVYVLYSRVIIVETFGPDAAAAKSLFSDLLQQQVAFAPPTQRNS